MPAILSPWEAAARQWERRASRYLHDPVAWAHDHIDWTGTNGLADYQEEILAALVDHHRAAVRGPHGLGKTGLASIVVLWFAETRDAAGIDWKIPTTASAWRQLKLFLWPEIHKWAKRVRWDKLDRPPYDGRRELLDWHLKLRHGSAFAVASKDPATIEGAHATHLLYLFDEAKTIGGDTFDAAEGAFSGAGSDTDAEAYALALSTPGPPAGRFYDIHKRSPGLEDWWTRHVTLDEAIAAGRISRQWADQRKIQWGEDSTRYHNRVLGEFHAGDEDAVIPLAWYEAAVARWQEWVDAGRPELEGRRVVGVDVARGGADSTVLAHRTGVAVTSLDIHRREDTMRTTARVQAALDGGLVTPVVDSVGVGGGVVDRLRELDVRVLAYTGGAKTDARDRTGEYGFVNVRSAAWHLLRELLDPAFDSEIMLPDDDILEGDLTAPTSSEVSGAPPKIKVEPKEDVIDRLGRSTDRGDAVVEAFWADRMHITSAAVMPTGQMPATGVSPLGAGVGGSPLGPLG